MSDSKKEKILQFIENGLKAIKVGTTIGSHSYANSISYVDRQFFQFTEQDVLEHPMPWIVINDNGELFEPQPSRRYDNTIYLQLIGFIKASKESPNLDSLMNSLQKDIVVAMLSNTNLSGLASWLSIKEIQIVQEMIYPFGGFVINLEINYSFIGTDL